MKRYSGKRKRTGFRSGKAYRLHRGSTVKRYGSSRGGVRL